MIGVGRSAERCPEAVRQIREQTGSTAVEYLVADLSSQADVPESPAKVKAATSRLDVLVNNAGLVRLKRELTVDGLEMTFRRNHLAYFLLTNLLLDTIKASAGPDRQRRLRGSPGLQAQLRPLARRGEVQPLACLPAVEARQHSLHA